MGCTHGSSSSPAAESPELASLWDLADWPPVQGAEQGAHPHSRRGHAGRPGLAWAGDEIPLTLPRQEAFRRVLQLCRAWRGRGRRRPGSGRRPESRVARWGAWKSLGMALGGWQSGCLLYRRRVGVLSSLPPVPGPWPALPLSRHCRLWGGRRLPTPARPVPFISVLSQHSRLGTKKSAFTHH